jgi:hypothetical protein
MLRFFDSGKTNFVVAKRSADIRSALRASLKTVCGTLRGQALAQRYANTSRLKKGRL